MALKPAKYLASTGATISLLSPFEATRPGAALYLHTHRRSARGSGHCAAALAGTGVPGHDAAWCYRGSSADQNTCTLCTHMLLLVRPQPQLPKVWHPSGRPCVWHTAWPDGSRPAACQWPHASGNIKWSRLQASGGTQQCRRRHSHSVKLVLVVLDRPPRLLHCHAHLQQAACRDSSGRCCCYAAAAMLLLRRCCCARDMMAGRMRCSRRMRCDVICLQSASGMEGCWWVEPMRRLL